MKRRKILVSAPRAVSELSRYEAALGPAGFDVVAREPVERLTEAELLPIVSDIDGIVCGDDQITRSVLDAAPRLRIICKWGTGLDSIDISAAEARGVVVCNTPGAFSDPVADTVLGYILLFARQLDQMAGDMRAGLWRRRPLVSLGECTLGIIGFGRIGAAVARRASAFGMRVLTVDLQAARRDHAPADSPADASLATALAESDYVTLHADMRPRNRHLIGEAELARMKSSAVLINTARGGLVHEQALVSALQCGRLAGAALDVFESEPLSADSPLRRMPNVYLAPHNANASPMAAERVHVNCIRNLLQVLNPTDHR